MSTVKSALGIPLLALSISLVVVTVGFTVPAETQPYALDMMPAATSTGPATTNALVSPTDVFTPMPTNIPRSAAMSRPQAPSSAETLIPILPLSGAEQFAGLLLPAILVLAIVLSCTYGAVTWNIR